MLTPFVRNQGMIVYDAKAEARSESLSDYLASYPKLEEALKACSLRFILNLPEEMSSKQRDPYPNKTSLICHKCRMEPLMCRCVLPH